MLTEAIMPRRVSRVVDRPRAGAGLQTSLRDDGASFAANRALKRPATFGSRSATGTYVAQR